MPKKRKRRKVNKTGFFDDIAPQTKQAIAAVGFTVLGIFFITSALEMAGTAGSITNTTLQFLFGWGSWLAPIVCFLYIYVLLRPREDESVSTAKTAGVILLFLSILGLFSLIDTTDTFSKSYGGAVGYGVALPFESMFGAMLTGVTLAALVIVGIFLTFNTHRLFPKIGRRDTAEDDDLEEGLFPDTEGDLMEDVPDDGPKEPEDSTEEVETPKKKSLRDKIGLGAANTGFTVSNFSGPYDPPPLSLLKKDKGKANVGDVKASSNIIKRTLKKFKIEVEMDEVTIGSSVTRYAIKPAEGVRLEKIVSLQNNLEYALAASPIRIEAPIPGKSLVGIEVPNKTNTTVGLASLLASAEYTDSAKPLLTALGRDITSNVHFADIARMPHALFSGTTGSGKSVAIHNVIISLLFRNSPEQLRFILVDPKRVELTLYNGIPHLLTPVIIDAKKAILSLKWAVKEMERRLEILSEHKVQNLTTYHEKVYRPAVKENEKLEGTEAALEKEDLPEPLPYIVIIIDELADLMSAYPRELEALIVRLAQMSRAAGIHLILSTQRPSVNVITGTIKANIPTRVAFQSASQIDSRTILDQPGAEKLLGKGDMLFLAGASPKPIRLQSAYITEDEVGKVVSYLKKQDDAHELDSINLEGDAANGSPDAFFSASLDDEDEDDLYDDARAVVMEAGKASTSYLQRKLRVGYSRAARLMDILEERGVIGPANGSKPREVIDTSSGDDDYDEEN